MSAGFSQSHYATLGLSRDDFSEAALKKTYRALASGLIAARRRKRDRDDDCSEEKEQEDQEEHQQSELEAAGAGEPQNSLSSAEALE